jgi:pimeloyl-ACP methyl ester carboxylesterase
MPAAATIATSTRPLPFVEGTEHRFVDAGGLNTHLAEAGDPDAPPLVLLHGWPQHWYMWRKQLPTLAQEFRVIAPDLRGLGWSEAPPAGYDKETLASDVLNLLDALALARVKLMGHDWGGWVGFLMCLRAPERFERFLALNIPPPWGAPPSLKLARSAWRMWYQGLNASPWLGRRVVQPGSRYMRAVFGQGRRGTWDKIARDSFIDQFAEPERARASQLIYRSFLLRELWPIARGRYADARLTVPTLLLFGKRDPGIPTSFLEADHARHADEFTLEQVEGCGHFIAEEQPALVTNRALEFFGG